MKTKKTRRKNEIADILRATRVIPSDSYPDSSSSSNIHIRTLINPPPPPRAKGSPGRAWRDGKQTTPGLRGEFLHVRKTNRKKYTYSLIALFSVYLYFITFLRRFLRLLLSRFIFAFIFRLFFIYRFLFFTDCLQNAKACFVPSLVPLFATMPLH